MTEKFQKSSSVFWTKHAREKMKFYRLSEARVKRVLHHPDRVEEGIAPKTMATMQKAGSQKYPSEIWVMYQQTHPLSFLKAKKPFSQSGMRIISTWRYPGQSPVGEKIKIPDSVRQDLIALGIISE